MTAIQFDVRTETWVTRERDPEDEWSNDSTDGQVRVLGAKIVERDVYDCLSIEKNLKVGDTIFLVWAQYSTGDSFGTYGGYYELLEVTADWASAHRRREHYEYVSDHSVPWNGYFDSLNGVYVEELVLQ